ncbi:ALG6 [Candida jiufengensis]|uniref:ALG6 n=1 Tax=Candida jiufengensis TaxID=497108 RepID=UPI002224344F|nr:ALG6 [Candida jiufengensis]KAI5957110.1 ALG6 [Candida jiufengensis]
MAKNKKKLKSKIEEKLPSIKSSTSSSSTIKDSHNKKNVKSKNSPTTKTTTKDSTKNVQAKLQRQPIEQHHQQSIFKDSPVYDLLHYFEKAPDQWAARYILILTSIILRTSVGLGNYSGFGTPPMYGDFEAQRHWMELTINLPLAEWYFFDLQYWGLDYPPLTAYHSYLIGKIGSFFQKDWFELGKSRGYESLELKFFMRLTSLVSEFLIYIPGILYLSNLLGKKFKLNRMDQIILCLVIINQPHLILIDHGHFQYNSIMLGFFIYSIIELCSNNLVVASIWFISCINFKQMGLYYSLFIFFYILSQLRNFKELVMIGFTVILTQVLYVLPFLVQKDFKSLINQIVIRIFPFNRGLFEDKVANFWCTTNLLVKYREFLSISQLSKLSLITTLISVIPINLLIFYKLKKSTTENKKISLLIYGFAQNSLSFYLFSYQVHEKSILIPIIPILLILFINHQSKQISLIQWINNLATFSLYPLLKKDDLILQYFVTLFVINWLIGFNKVFPSPPKKFEFNIVNLNTVVIYLTYLLVVIYRLLDAFINPPVNLPDLWIILNTSISFVGFGYFWIWLIYIIIIT